MSSLFTFAVFSILLASAAAQSLNVVNLCSEEVFLFTQTSFGTISNNIQVPAGATQNMGISSNWDGAVNVGKCSSEVGPHPFYSYYLVAGTGCGSDVNSCATGGPAWDGQTPFSRAEFNWVILSQILTGAIIIVSFSSLPFQDRSLTISV